MPSNKILALSLAGAMVFAAGTTAAVYELFDDDDDTYTVIVQQPQAQPAPAAPAAPATAAPATAAPAGTVGSDQAAAIAGAAAGGVAIDVSPGWEDGRSVYYVDVRTDAGMVEVYLDAATGEVLRVEPGS